MKIAHSMSGIRMSFTEAEHAMLPERVIVTIQPSSALEFLTLSPGTADDPGLKVITANRSDSNFPWRVEIKGAHRGLRYFGVEVVELTGRRDGSFVAPRPRGDKPPQRSGVPTKNRASKGRPRRDAVVPNSSLDRSIDIVNDYKRLLSDKMVMEITGDGYLSVLVQFGSDR